MMVNISVLRSRKRNQGIYYLLLLDIFRQDVFGEYITVMHDIPETEDVIVILLEAPTHFS